VSADKGGPRDWDKELADIDKLIASGPSPAPAQLPAKGKAAGPAPSGGKREAGAGAGGAGAGRQERIAVVLWFSLATLMGVGLTFLWPYARECGLGLGGYLGAIGAFGLASMWSTIWSWRTRNAAVHFLSIGLLGWSAFLGAREVLPRIGYAKQNATWQCVAPAPAPTPQAPAAPR
jgi:hypothetical protein